MWWLLLLLCSLVGCFLIVLILGLLRAGRRADEAEEKLLEIISPAPPISVANAKSKAADYDSREEVLVHPR
jgi:hypothetical protein